MRSMKLSTIGINPSRATSIHSTTYMAVTKTTLRYSRMSELSIVECLDALNLAETEFIAFFGCL
ncbi:hypothetical protein BREU_2007 [Bifidobacterium reuteri DSM 23975]|uniref:Uncharacterized protein n=1 Tax=Bifidobacterium reuteri DSM 23975 TaxID=1437610 RepID=A0A087CPT2_9BIFI|nr:hypothetical protein BREU_2007 [Bifidobacterium reuteri DSM 23975]